MTISDTEAFFDIDNAPDPLHHDLKRVVRQHSYHHPRGHQRQLGASEVGHPCTRKMVQSLLFGSGRTATGAPINPPGDPLPSYIGTAAHKQLEEALAHDNAQLEACGQPARWIPERKVVVREDLTGTCDCYDVDTRTVIDWKFPGTVAMSDYRRNGPSPEYRTQAHLYGAGYINAGYKVDRVAIWFLPRAGRLASAHLWTEPYDPDVAEEVLARIDFAHNIIASLDVETFPGRLKFVPTTPHKCMWCPYWTPVPHDNPAACQGDAP